MGTRRPARKRFIQEAVDVNNRVTRVTLCNPACHHIEHCFFGVFNTLVPGDTSQPLAISFGIGNHPHCHFDTL